MKPKTTSYPTRDFLIYLINDFLKRNIELEVILIPRELDRSLTEEVFLFYQSSNDYYSSSFAKGSLFGVPICPTDYDKIICVSKTSETILLADAPNNRYLSNPIDSMFVNIKEEVQPKKKETRTSPKPKKNSKKQTRKLRLD